MIRYNKKCLHLQDEDFLFQGDNRACYVHPHDDNSCVKILHAGRHKKVQQRELRYFNSLYRRKADMSKVARLLEVCPTNKGEGVVFELIRDFDGSISKTVHDYLIQNKPEYDAMLVDKIAELKAYLYTEAIVFRDLITLNMLIQRKSATDFSIVVVDGIGHDDFIPICNISKRLARKKIIRMWNKKRGKWFEHYPQLAGKVTDFAEL